MTDDNQNHMQRDRDYIPLWYIMDEVGSRVNHSDTPNFEFKPFYFMEQDITFTIIFPLQDLENGGMFGHDWMEFLGAPHR